MKRHNASVLINDGDLRIYTPEFHNNWKNDFIVVKDFKKQGITVLRLKTE